MMSGLAQGAAVVLSAGVVTAFWYQVRRPDGGFRRHPGIRRVWLLRFGILAGVGLLTVLGGSLVSLALSVTGTAPTGAKLVSAVGLQIVVAFEPWSKADEA